jgi:hypothetical protein
MCSAKASAATSGLPRSGDDKRYYSGYTLANASYDKEGLSSVRASSSQWPLMDTQRQLVGTHQFGRYRT